MDNGQADTGREGRTCLARPNSQAQTGTIKKCSFSLFSCPRAGLVTSLGCNILPYVITIYTANYMSAVQRLHAQSLKKHLSTSKPSEHPPNSLWESQSCLVASLSGRSLCMYNNNNRLSNHFVDSTFERIVSSGQAHAYRTTYRGPSPFQRLRLLRVSQSLTVNVRIYNDR